MDAERARAFLLTLPHVVETMQWGDNLVFWVGEKVLGGKMFTLLPLDAAQGGVIQAVVSYPAGPDRFPELVERDGLIPAPYFARIFWVAAQTWSVHRDPAWEDQFRHAHRLTLDKLPPKTRALLALPAPERKRLLAERKRALAERERAAAIPKKSASSKPASPEPKTPATRGKAANAANLALAAKAARPKKHRQR